MGVFESKNLVRVQDHERQRVILLGIIQVKLLSNLEVFLSQIQSKIRWIFGKPKNKPLKKTNLVTKVLAIRKESRNSKILNRKQLPIAYDSN